MTPKTDRSRRIRNHLSGKPLLPNRQRRASPPARARADKVAGHSVFRSDTDARRSSSAQTRSEVEVRRLCREVERAVAEGSRWHWIAGDLLLRVTSMYVAGRKVTLKLAQKRYIPRLSYPMMSQLRSTAEAFPEQGARQFAIENDISWFECDVARRTLRNLKLKGAVPEDHSIEGILRDFLETKGKARNLREVTKRCIAGRIARARQEATKNWNRLKRQQPPWLESCHNRSCLDVLGGLAPGSVTVAWFDPPYAQYQRAEDGGRHSEHDDPSGVLTDCDGDTREEALALTVAGVRQGFRVLNDRGVMVLFQAATEPDRPEVVIAAREAGYGAILPLYWQKQNIQPGNFETPFTVSTERILLLAKNRDALADFAPHLRRGDVVNQSYIEETERAELQGMGLQGFGSPSQETIYKFKTGAAAIGQVHVFEKPASLAMFFFRKLTLPGDMVVDMCGCSGSMVEAAIRAKLRWIYCETNKSNFAFGVRRIQRAVSGDC